MRSKDLYILCILFVYTMKDIYDGVVLCDNCGKKTSKDHITRDGFKIRILKCDNCGQKLYHPTDIEKYHKFNKLKGKSFNVKLRMVGNSFCVSIPKEIIEFRKLEKEFDEMVSLCLDNPERLSLYFSKKFKDIISK